MKSTDIKPSELLRLALSRLNTNVKHCSKKSWFVCNAISYAAGYRDNTQYARYILLQYIGEVLGECGTVSDWLIEQGIKPNCYSFYKLQKYRLAWMHHMIDEYRKKGM